MPSGFKPALSVPTATLPRGCHSARAAGEETEAQAGEEMVPGEHGHGARGWNLRGQSGPVGTVASPAKRRPRAGTGASRAPAGTAAQTEVAGRDPGGAAAALHAWAQPGPGRAGARPRTPTLMELAAALTRAAPCGPPPRPGSPVGSSHVPRASRNSRAPALRADVSARPRYGVLNVPSAHDGQSR